MKIVLGVDDMARAKDGGDMLEALRFPQPKVDVVHVIERWGSTPIPRARTHAGAGDMLLEMQQSQGNELLAAVQADLERRALGPTETHLLTGFISNRLLEHADATQADLVAVTSSGKGPLEGIMIGSVSRKIVVASPRSVLVTKRPVDPARPLTVVLATDHSPYATKCVETFARWAPKGIARLVVTTVYPEQLVKAMMSVEKSFKADLDGWVSSELERSNQEVIGCLSGLTAQCVSRVETGSVSDTLERVMKEEQGDLLVLGAQGHGFFERITLGSVSLEQAVKKPYSVLVVRE